MKKLILTYGIIYGVLVFLFTFYIPLNNILGALPSIGLSLLAMFVVLVLPVIFFKKKNGGFITFQDIFKICVGVAIVGVLLGVVMHEIYELTLSEEQKQKIITEYVDSVVASFDNSTTALDTDELEEKMTEGAEMMFDFTTNLLSSLSYLFFVLIIAVILGLIFKKEPPQTIA